MIFTTGGRASGATSTKSRPRSWAAASASSTVNTPSCAPSGAITRRGLIRICRFTRIRGALLFGLSIARCGPPQQKKKRIPGPGIRVTPPVIDGRRSQNPRALPGPERQREGGAGGHHVGQETEGLAPAFDQHRLMKGGMPRRRQAADPGNDLHLAVDRHEGDRVNVSGEVASGRALVEPASELELTPLHH